MDFIPAIILALLAGLHCARSHPNSGVPSTLVKCPDTRYCKCNMHEVQCSHLRHWDWKRLLQNIPPSINKLTLMWSKVHIPQEELPANYTFPFLYDIVLFGIQSAPPSGIVLSDTLLKPFPNLLSLNFSYSNVDEVESKALSHTPLLERLILTGNNIHRIYNDCFNNITRLHTFHASFSQYLTMNSLPKNLFSPLVSLTEVDLSGGYLKYIHPSTFRNNTKLKVIKLSNNKLETLQEGTFDHLPDLTEIHIYDNPFECSCELHWLVDELESRKAYQYLQFIICVRRQSPFSYLDDRVEENVTNSASSSNSNLTALLSEYAATSDVRIKEIHRLMDVSKEDIPCVAPKIYIWESDPNKNWTVLRITNRRHMCLAEGIPRPFVYWVTPVGLLAATDNLGWHDPETFYEEFDNLHRFIAPPTYRKAHIEVFKNNTLAFWNMRQYFAGNYACIAINPAGNVTRLLKVEVTTMLKTYMIRSVIAGSILAAAFAIGSVIFAPIKYLVVRRCARCARFKVQPEDDFDPTDLESIAREYPDYYEIFCTADGLTPYLTPIKCSTPYEAEDAEIYRVAHRAQILEQLSEVRERLRNGMVRHVGRIRSYSQHMRDSSSTAMHNIRYSSARYMHNFRDSSNMYMQKLRYNTGHYMHTLRSSSSNYAQRMRVGVAMATEQVKSSMQSMKEFCGTGELTQTISTVSFQTDVDSQEVCQIVMKQTYV